MINDLFAKNEKIYPVHISKHFKSYTRNHSSNEIERMRMALSCSKYITYIIVTNDVKTLVIFIA